jgi:hypothetical protein
MLTITTKFLPPTDNRSARIKSTVHSPIFQEGSGSTTLAYDHSLGDYENQRRGAKAALDMFNNKTREQSRVSIDDMSVGALSDGYAFVITSMKANY